jgi:threonine aldolase
VAFKDSTGHRDRSQTCQVASAEASELLGKEAAVLMPTGTMAQQIALRIWSGRRAQSRFDVEA